jgi:hypothetical protein
MIVFEEFKPSINYHPVNPLILVILICDKYKFHHQPTIYKLPSCTSFNPGYYLDLLRQAQYKSLDNHLICDN